MQIRPDRISISWSLLAFVMGAFFVMALGAQRVGVPKSIEAQEFILKDAAGVRRAQFICDPDSAAVQFTIMDKEQRPRIGMGVLPSGEAVVFLSGRDGMPRVKFATTSKDDLPLIDLRDKPRNGEMGKSLLSLFTMPDSSAGLELSEPITGHQRIRLSVLADGKAGLTIHSKDGISGSFIGVNAAGRPRVSLSAKPTVNSIFDLTDQGAGEIRLSDETGKPSWFAPTKP